MKWLRLGLVLALAANSVWAADPIVGRWLLVSQEVGGQKSPIDELTLRINAVGKVPGQALEFAYSVPVRDIQFVSLRFTVKPDGTQADVTDANGRKVGTVKVTKASPSRYRVVLAGEGRPTANGGMTVSADGKTLTSESDSVRPGTPSPITSRRRTSIAS
jgi:hypothetical protein